MSRAPPPSEPRGPSGSGKKRTAPSTCQPRVLLCCHSHLRAFAPALPAASYLSPRLPFSGLSPHSSQLRVTESTSSPPDTEPSWP